MAEPGERNVHDVYGRRYWVGPSDRVLLGYPRSWIAAAACAIMLAVGGTQYGFGAFAVRLAAVHHWGPLAAGWGFAAWVACQSAASGALPACRRRLGATPAKTVITGAVCCALGLLLIGRIADPAGALAAYAVTAGTGAGLVYGTCVAVVADWFPDQHVPTALVSGAFGFGAIPVILAVAGAGDPAAPLSVLAWVLLAVTALCAPLLRDAPRRWWPSEIDPRRWAVDRVLNPTLRQDPPALREHSPAQVLRTRAAWVLAALALSVWTVALFDVAALPSFAQARGWSPRDGAITLALFAAGSGGVRTLAVRLAGRIGRNRVAALAGGAAGITQLLLALAGERQVLALLWLAAAAAGAAAGTWFALLPGLVRSYFGDLPGRPNLWLLYSAKAAGGVLGAGVIGWVAVRSGYPAALITSGALGIGAAAGVPLPRRPGMPRTLPRVPQPH
ncbi:MAG TPA: MFS transporter [Trebonia sp.]|nr:MFS transporter [Trebonia sp.]